MIVNRLWPTLNSHYNHHINQKFYHYLKIVSKISIQINFASELFALCQDYAIYHCVQCQVSTQCDYAMLYIIGNISFFTFCWAVCRNMFLLCSTNKHLYTYKLNCTTFI